MHALRTSRSLARLVLGWFALVLVLSTASAIAYPKALQVLCMGSGGTKLVMVSAESGAPSGDPALSSGGHSMDCPLCLAVVPPPARAEPFLPGPHSAGAYFRLNAQRIARAPAPALPARGPPLFS